MFQSIRLPGGEWLYDPDKLLGRPGAFGAVFLGRSERYGEVAVKRLKDDAANYAHRELTIASGLSGRAFAHVIPIYDSGLDAETYFYFVVMAKAERSLNDDLEKGVRFKSAEAAKVLLEIARGLTEASQLVHRDLKPANILFHDGKWKIADFGIARFVEESTSLETLKGCLTPAYAAPEQFERGTATSATDIYALGCIGYALITGKAPFPGPKDEYHNQHCLSTPPSLPDVDPLLQSLFSTMLRKAPDGRPSRERVLRLLEQIAARPADQQAGSALFGLAAVAASISAATAEKEAQERTRVARQLNRAKQCEEAVASLKEYIVQPMFRMIHDTFINSKISDNEVLFDKSILQVYWGDRPVNEYVFPESGWDVVACGMIRVFQEIPRCRWSAALWYAKLPGQDDYLWYETSYYLKEPYGTLPEKFRFPPFELTDEMVNADQAFAKADARFGVAFGPIPIDFDETPAFQSRWFRLFGQACLGKLQTPGRFPLPPGWWEAEL